MISYEYFMDVLADYELTTLLDCVDYAYVEEWLQTRMLLWGLFKAQSGKKWNKKPNDLFPLAVDGSTHKAADELEEEEQDWLRNIFHNASQAFSEKNSEEHEWQETKCQ